MQASFFRKINAIIEQFGSAMQANNSVACFILQRIYLEKVPALFDFVATYFRNETVILNLLKLLWF